MKKIIYAMAILFVVLSVEHLYDVYGVRGASKETGELSEVVARTFDSAGIYESESDIEGYYYYGSMYLGEESCHELLSKMAGYVGVTSEYEYSRNRTDSGYEAVLVKEAESSRLELKLITVENEVNENLISQQQYISISLKINNSVGSGFYYRKIIADGVERILKEAKAKYDDTDEYDKRRHKLIDSLEVSIKGKIYGNMSLDRQKEIADEITSGIGSQNVFDNVENKDNADLYSLYAYTPEISDYVAVGKDKINVNVVFTFSEEENVTYIHIGSPIVNYDY